MLILVVAVCLTVPSTDVSPSFQTCSLIRTHQKFDDVKSCESFKANLARDLQKDKKLKVAGYRCVDSQKLDAVIKPVKPPETNPVDPKLKPLTPEQKKQGVESL